MKFQVPIHVSVAAILVLTLLGAGVIVAQNGVQQTPRIAAPAPAPSPCVEGGAAMNAAFPPPTANGCCGALSEGLAPAVSKPVAADAGCCGGSAVGPAANTGCGAAVPADGSVPAVFENMGTPAPSYGGCCGAPPAMPPATNGSPNVLAVGMP